MFQRGSQISFAPDEEVGRRHQLSSHSLIECTFTPHGIRTALPFLPVSAFLPVTTGGPESSPLSDWCFAILDYQIHSHPRCLFRKVCHIPPSRSNIDLVYCGGIVARKGNKSDVAQLFNLSLATVDRRVPLIKTRTVHISHPARDGRDLDGARWQLDEWFYMTLRRRARDALRARGYAAIC